MYWMIDHLTGKTTSFIINNCVEDLMASTQRAKSPTDSYLLKEKNYESISSF